jgi:two-component system alkaline phosphatase synthesis response regulator PhoP
MHKILIIDDSSDIQELLKAVLTLKDFQVLSALTAKDGVALAKKQNPDVIVLDLMLPDVDGIDVCKTLKELPETKDIPIIMLTARTTVLDRIKGLEIGANDYLTKPFDTLELIARIKVQLRQRKVILEKARTPLKLNQFEIDPASYKFSIGAKLIKHMTPREFDILYILMKNSPIPVQRDTIFKILSGKIEKNSRVIDIHIAKIRKKIGTDCIKTIPGKGYLFSA